MQVKKSTPSPTNVTLVIKLTDKDLLPVKNEVVKRQGASLKIPGFRPGKAPLTTQEKALDPNLLQTEVLDEAINHAYGQAIEEQKLRPVGQPELTVKKFVPFTEAELEIKLEVIGEIKLPDYKKIKKTLPTVAVGAKAIDEVIKNIAQQMAVKTDVDRAAKDGDQVYLDFKGTDAKGQAVPGADGNDYPLTLGSKAFIPGFEENLIGLKAGDLKEFPLTFPKDYGAAELAGKKVTFAVDITKVQEATKPKIDNEFAAKAGPFKDVAELKANIKTQLLAERHAEATRQLENDLIHEISNKSTVEMPERLIDEQLEQAEQEERQNLAYRGQTWAEHLAEEGLTEEQHHTKNRPIAADRVKAGLVLSQISENEGFDVAPEELDLRIQLLKGQYQDQAMQAELDKPENRRTIIMRILTEKTLAKLVDYATAPKATK